jgi:hypothetical protein
MNGLVAAGPTARPQGLSAGRPPAADLPAEAHPAHPLTHPIYL